MEKENQQQEYLQELRHETSRVSEEEYIFPISPRFIIISFAACNIFFFCSYFFLMTLKFSNGLSGPNNSETEKSPV